MSISDSVSVHRLGLLGLGEGRSILSAVAASPHWEIGRLCDLDTELCRARSVEAGGASWTTDYDELLADESIDTIAVFTPDALHAEHTRRALEAGKHVLCTKPVLLDLTPATALLELASKKKRQVFVGHSCRFFETLMRQRADFLAARHGQLLSVEAHYHGDKRKGASGRWGKSGAVDWLFTGVTHPADLVYWYLGPIEEISGVGCFSPAGQALGQKNPDMLHFVVRSCSGAIGTIGGCYGAPHAPMTAQAMIACTLRGARGVSVANYPDFTYHHAFDGEEAKRHDHRDRHDYYFRFGGYKHHAGEFQNYLEYFARCLDAGETARPNLADGVEIAATLIAGREAIASRRAVRVAEVLERHGLLEVVRRKS